MSRPEVKASRLMDGVEVGTTATAVEVEVRVQFADVKYER